MRMAKARVGNGEIAKMLRGQNKGRTFGLRVTCDILGGRGQIVSANVIPSASQHVTTNDHRSFDLTANGNNKRVRGSNAIIFHLA